MTRENLLEECIHSLKKGNFTIIEAATGVGKTAIALKMVNHLISTKYKGKKTSMLLLVAKIVHKQTWQDEFNKWGGIDVDNLTIECYESLKKHEYENFDIVVADEVHHLNSEKRLDLLSTLTFGNFIGLSATIPMKLKQYFKYEYHTEIVSCNLIEAIDSNILPDPKIILMPLELDNNILKEFIELYPSAKGRTYHSTYAELWKYKKLKVHAIISCTEKQRLIEYDNQIRWEKNMFTRTRQDFMKNRWLHDCGERIKYLANLKNDVVLEILEKLSNERTITFCKTIEQANILGKYSIHSKNLNSQAIYDAFNSKRINHIASVNVLNEGANLVDCKYAIFANYSSSEVCSVQRCGRALRHKSPVIIMPYYRGTREQEIVDSMIEGFNPDNIKTAKTPRELMRLLEKK